MGLIRKYITLLIMFTGWNGLHAQSDINFLAERYDMYHAQCPKTKVQLVFHQDKYTPGDTVFFKAYNITEDLLRISGQQVAHVHLTDFAGTSLDYFKFLLKDGVGANQMVIPENAEPGYYLVTAYTDWMRNWGEDIFFEQIIPVVSDQSFQAANTPNIKAMPEGGILVAGVPNNIGIYSNLENDNIFLQDQNDIVIDTIRTDLKGLATYRFTPQQGMSYVLRSQEQDLMIKLPEVSSQAYTLELTSKKPKEDLIQFQASASPGAEIRNQKINVLVTSRGRVYNVAEFTQETRPFVPLNIPVSDLPEGIAQITLIGPQEQILASRPFYVGKPNPINAIIKTDKEEFKPRAPVRLEIAITDDNGQPVLGEFSVKATHAALFSDVAASSFNRQLVLPAMTGNAISEDPNGQALQEIDLYILTNATSEPWSEILSGKKRNLLNAVNSSNLKSGKAIHSKSGKPISATSKIMFYMQDSGDLYLSGISEGGEFSLDLSEVYGQDELFSVAETRKGNEIEDLEIEWQTEIPALINKAPPTRFTNDADEYAYYANKSKLIAQSYNLFNAKSDTSEQWFLQSIPVFEDRFIEADISYNMEDYRTFGTMEELVKEVINPLKLYKQGNRRLMRVRYHDPDTGNGRPLYFINGKATKNTEFFLSLEPSEVQSIKIIRTPKKLQRLGFMGRNGIIMIETRSKDINSPIDPGSQFLGIRRPIPYSHRDHSRSENTRIPDFRSTLYWNPSVTTNKAGKATLEFYTSDDVGTYDIKIEGLTVNGQPFTATRKISIGKPESN
ncbi:MAG: hypothetical protein KJP00_05940 [Bacteroidia bacterium]|nr:hypothetical protein [Bacteroidia bacterium]